MIPMVKLSTAILDAVEMDNEYYLNKRPWLYKLAQRALTDIRNIYVYVPAIHVIQLGVLMTNGMLVEGHEYEVRGGGGISYNGDDVLAGDTFTAVAGENDWIDLFPNDLSSVYGNVDRIVEVPENVFRVLAFVPGDQGVNSWNLFNCSRSQSLGFIADPIQYDVYGNPIPSTLPEYQLDSFLMSQIQWYGGDTIPFTANRNDHNIIGNQLIFNSPVTFEYVTMLTRDYNVDIEGEILIPDLCVEVISKYLQINIARVELNDMIRKGQNNYVASNALKEAKQEYNQLLARTRGRLYNLQEAETNILLKYFN